MLCSDVSIVVIISLITHFVHHVSEYSPVIGPTPTEWWDDASIYGKWASPQTTFPLSTSGLACKTNERNEYLTTCHYQSSV